MKQRTIGVIGHVDHGKTSLVRALTGIDTDRLPEEKARGMSIVPGFAWLAFPEGTVDLVDVPGHEDYLRAMIAGAAGIDAVLLVVDAHEGVRRQTHEHLAVARLLGVQAGMVALSKVDLLAPHERAAAAAALPAALGGTMLARAPLVACSATSGEGLDAVKASLRELLQSAPAVDASGAFFIGVDRAFTVAGRGTVVTGTVRGGALTLGAEAEVFPGGVRAMVRQLQVHGHDAETALPGQRVGINLRGVKLEQVGRGTVVAAPGMVTPRDAFDVEIEIAAGCSVRSGEPLRVFLGTDSVTARVRVRGAPSPVTGARVGRLRCARSVCAIAGERFVLRSDAAHRTLGGGRVLAPRESSVLDDPSVAAQLEGRLLAALADFHARNPTHEGATLAWWRGQLPRATEARVFEQLAARLVGERRVEISGERVRMAGFDPLRDLPPVQRACAEQLERLFREAGVQPPDVAGTVGADANRAAVCRLLVARGRLVRLGRNGDIPIFCHRDTLARARSDLASAFPPPAAFTASQARERLGATRRFVIPLLEFLEAERCMVRRGPLHAFLSANEPAGNHPPAAPSQTRR
ncbi:MAG TPA: selenocysteine-specific translation elongation factor [Usitatibacter sp.]|nr:selenocysteine-specific translation elongation factor [Usitatibacter sp.]